MEREKHRFTNWVCEHIKNIRSINDRFNIKVTEKKKGLYFFLLRKNSTTRMMKRFMYVFERGEGQV